MARRPACGPRAAPLAPARLPGGDPAVLSLPYRPAYGWPGECETRFGTHPVQVVHEWNTAVHVAQAEGDPIKRAFTIDELQAFFDHADGQVARIRGAGRKGWLPAFRDATLFKIAYGYGLRRKESRMLDVADFGANPHAPEFGEGGICYVRHSKRR